MSPTAINFRVRWHVYYTSALSHILTYDAYMPKSMLQYIIQFNLKDIIYPRSHDEKLAINVAAAHPLNFIKGRFAM